jgi:hypothetical protein
MQGTIPEEPVVTLTPAKQPSTEGVRQAIYKFLIVKPDKLKAFIKGASQGKAEALLQACIDIDNERKEAEGWEAV